MSERGRIDSAGSSERASSREAFNSSSSQFTNRTTFIRPSLNAVSSPRPRTKQLRSVSTREKKSLPPSMRRQSG